MEERGLAARIVSGLASVILLTGCAAGATPSPPAATAPPSATVAPSATVSPASLSVAVSGRESCEFLGMGTINEGEFLVTQDERYRCAEQMSDARAQRERPTPVAS